LLQALAALLFGALHPKRKDRAGANGHRFERVSVEGREVVLDVEIVVPVEVAQHEARAEAGGAPVSQIAINPPGLPYEVLP